MPEISANLPPNWMSAPLGNLVDILDFQRRPINSEERVKRPGNVPYFGATGQVGWIDDYLFDEELVLLGEDGAPFLDPVKSKAYLIRGKSWVNNHAHVLKGRCGISNRFLMYQLNQVDYRRFVSGTTRLKLPQAPMKLIPLLVAPEPEQFRIVAEIEKQFTRLEAGVVALKRVQANLKRYRAAVLKAAVEGRLVPTEAELARREGRSYEPASELLAPLVTQPLLAVSKKAQAGVPVPPKQRHKAPFTPDTTDSPKLPEGWAWVRWDQVGFSQNGRAFPSSEYTNAGIKLLRPGNLHVSGRVEWTAENTRHLPEEWALEFPTFVVGPGELVINLTAQSLKDEFLGRVCISANGERCLLNQRIARLRPIKVSPHYLLWMFKSNVFRRFVDDLNTGSLIQHMFTSQLAEFTLPLPPLAEQHRIVAEVERRLSVIDELEMQVEANLKRAERLRQSILKRAFEGKLVPQDPNDEPASMLLERIKNAKSTGKSACATGDTATPGCAGASGKATLGCAGKRSKSEKAQAGVPVPRI